MARQRITRSCTTVIRAWRRRHREWREPGRRAGTACVRRHAERATSVEQDAGAASRMRTRAGGREGAERRRLWTSARRVAARTRPGRSGSRRSSARAAASGQAVLRPGARRARGVRPGWFGRKRVRPGRVGRGWVEAERAEPKQFAAGHRRWRRGGAGGGMAGERRRGRVGTWLGGVGRRADSRAGVGFFGCGERSAAAGWAAQRQDQHPAVRAADPAGGDDGLRHVGQDTAAAVRTAVPGRGAGHRRALAAAGGVRLDAVPRAAAGLAGLRREARHQERRRDGVPDQVLGAGAVRARPDRPGPAWCTGST